VNVLDISLTFWIELLTDIFSSVNKSNLLATLRTPKEPPKVWKLSYKQLPLSKVPLSPATPTYTLSKSIASSTQISNIYNISNYVREYIVPVKPTLVTTPAVEENNAWAICKVKRYKLVGTTYTLLDTIEYVCIDGFTTYNNGRQITIDVTIGNSPALALSNQNIIVNYYNNSYLNLICKKNDEFDLAARYYTKSDILIQTQIILTSGVDNEYFNYKVPLRYSLGTLDYQKLVLSYEEAFFQKIHIKTEECKFTPVNCSFINRYGGWEFLTFFKQQSNSISIKGTNYKLMPSSVDYNVSIGQSKTLNINGTQSVKLNTGFVNENYSELITDLLLSETVLLNDKPVIVKTQGSDLKTSLKDRLINYEIEFEYAYNLINDVIWLQLVYILKIQLVRNTIE